MNKSLVNVLKSLSDLSHPVHINEIFMMLCDKLSERKNTWVAQKNDTSNGVCVCVWLRVCLLVRLRVRLRTCAK